VKGSEPWGFCDKEAFESFLSQFYNNMERGRTFMIRPDQEEESGSAEVVPH
jgi:hypothetical protein